jgi:hypothetical protein
MTERSTDERLDHFARSVEAFATATETNISELQRLAEESRRAQNGMFRAMDALAVSQVEILQRVDNTLQRIDEVQNEVRGLQTENRRIMDRLFGQQSN